MTNKIKTQTRTKVKNKTFHAAPDDQAHDPRYAVFVAVDEPQETAKSYGYATGGWVAAPTVANIIKSMVSILGVEPYKRDENDVDNLRRYVAVKN